MYLVSIVRISGGLKGVLLSGGWGGRGVRPGSAGGGGGLGGRVWRGLQSGPWTF